MAVDRCTLIARELAKILDSHLTRDLDWSVESRRAAKPSVSMWGPLQGVRVSEIAGGFAESTLREFLTISDLISSSGAAGRTLAAQAKAFFLTWRTNSSQDVMRLRPFLENLNTLEKRNLVETIEQRSLTPLDNGLLEPTGSRAIKPINARVERAVRETKNYFRDIASDASDRKILNGYHENYWPHMRDTSLMGSSAYEKKAHEALAYQEAAFRVANEKGVSPYSLNKDDIIVTDIDKKHAIASYETFYLPQLARIAPNIEMKRVLDIPGYDVEPLRVIRRYAQSVRSRFAEQDLWGERDTLHGTPKALREAVSQVKQDLGSSSLKVAQVTAFMDNMLGYSPAANGPFSRFMGDVQAAKLSLSVFGNATQSANTIMRTNLSAYGKAVAALVADKEIVGGMGARDFALNSGLIIDNVLKDAQLYQGGRVGEFLLTWNGFAGVEKMNRMLSAVTGAVYLREQYDTAAAKGIFSNRAKTRLSELGFDFNKLDTKHGPDYHDLIIAARRIVDETQCANLPMDLPRYLQHPRLRWMMEFKSFSYNQLNFMLRELQRRPGRALVFGFGVMPAIGQGVEFARDIIGEVAGATPSQFQEGQSNLSDYIESMVAAGSFGIAADMAFQLAASAQTGETPYRFAMPPRVSTFIEIGAAASDVMAGRNEAAAKKFMRQFGGIGSIGARAVID